MYYDVFEPQKIELYRDVCHRFAMATEKQKPHLILHLPDSVLRFGPASSSTQKGKFHNVHEAKILYGTYCVSGVRATIL